MRKCLDKTWAKVTSFCLLLVFTALAVAGGAGIYYLADNNAYLDGGERLLGEVRENTCRGDILRVRGYLEDTQDEFTVPPTRKYAGAFSSCFKDNTCAVTVRSGDTVLLTNRALSGPALCSLSYDLEINGRSVTVGASLDQAGADKYYELVIVQRLVQWRRVLAAAEFLCLAAWIFCLAFTLASAGHWRGHEGIHLTWLDRVPVEIWIAAMLVWGAAADDILYSAAPIFFAAAALLVYLFLPAFAAQCKAGTVFRGSAVAWLLRLLRRVFAWAARVGKVIPLVWKTVLGVVVLLLFDCICAVNGHDGEFLVIMILVNALAGLFLIYLAMGLREIQKGGRALAAGDYSVAVDTRRLFGDFRRHGQDLNTVQQGVRKAVEQQMRAERMKTELITNVSHDIKTPLTSIVNYVDLLKKERIDNPAAAEYIEVLDRQSGRLRKLTEDLLEASKAASGSMPVSLADTDVNVFLTQVMGEYRQKLSENRIDPVLDLDRDDPHIRADGKLLWRVLDNLLGNVCKYAMPGTRVYLSSETADGSVYITVRNISMYPLNVPSDELTERFVRGDVSRSSEGSGLGLSIAMGLTELQNGRFRLSVDGDLFKVQLGFERA